MLSYQTPLIFMSNNSLSKYNELNEVQPSKETKNTSEPIYSILQTPALNEAKKNDTPIFLFIENIATDTSANSSTPIKYPVHFTTNNIIDASPIIPMHSSPDCLQEQYNGSNVTLVSTTSAATIFSNKSDLHSPNQSMHSEDILVQNANLSQDDRLRSIENGILEIRKTLNVCLENQSQLYNAINIVQKRQKIPAHTHLPQNFRFQPTVAFQSSDKACTMSNASAKFNPLTGAPILYSKNSTQSSHSPPLIKSFITIHSDRNLAKFPSHSCSMYNKSIRDLSNPDTIEWPNDCIHKLGPNASIDQIKDVITQTNTITHFTAEFQKVVFSSDERKTLTTSGKFRKRKLDRVVLGQLDTTKLQAIIELSIFLFGVTEEDEDRVKYQLKQAIDEKNRREFYREDRGSKRPNLMANTTI